MTKMQHFKRQIKASKKHESLINKPKKAPLYLLILASLTLMAFTFLPEMNGRKTFERKSPSVERTQTVPQKSLQLVKYPYQFQFSVSQESPMLGMETSLTQYGNTAYFSLFGPNYSYFPFYFRITPSKNSKEFYLGFDGYLKEKSAYFYHCIVYDQQNQIVKSNSYAYQNKPHKALVSFSDLEKGDYKLEIRYGALKQSFDLKI